MKRLPLFITAGVLALAAASPFAPNVLANINPEVANQNFSIPQSEYPLGQNVVITVDPQHSSKPVYAGDANIITGFDAPDAVRGILVEEKEHWLILREKSFFHLHLHLRALLLHLRAIGHQAQL